MKPQSEIARERLRKLANLVTGGLGGEQENAERIFEEQLKKHGFRREEFFNTEEKIVREEVRVRNADGLELLCQVIGKVKDEHSPHYYKTRVRGHALIEGTRAQCAEIKFLFSIYHEAFRKEQENLKLAFICKHKIWAASPNPNSKGSTMSDAEIARLKAMAQAIGDVQINKALEHRKTQ